MSANLKAWILDAADGEKVLGIVIGNMGWSDYQLESIPEESQNKKHWNKVLSWKDAEKLVDYTFDDGYGAPGCQAITAWTKDRVIFVKQYDGSTRINWVPRNPIDHTPNMPGGG